MAEQAGDSFQMPLKPDRLLGQGSEECWPSGYQWRVDHEKGVSAGVVGAVAAMYCVWIFFFSSFLFFSFFSSSLLFLLKFAFLFVCLCHIWQYSKLTSHPVLSYHSWQSSENHIGCQVLDTDWLHTRHTLYLMYFHSSPYYFFFLWIFNKIDWTRIGIMKGKNPFYISMTLQKNIIFYLYDQYFLL